MSGRYPAALPILTAATVPGSVDRCSYEIVCPNGLRRWIDVSLVDNDPRDLVRKLCDDTIHEMAELAARLLDWS